MRAERERCRARSADQLFQDIPLFCGSDEKLITFDIIL
jgi:hypothetical protein